MHNGFTQELARWGPQARYEAVSRVDAQAYCAKLARTHYENFSVATLLLPRRLIPHFHNIYAYCRWADDLGDETGGGQHALDLLQWWREELLRCTAKTREEDVTSCSVQRKMLRKATERLTLCEDRMRLIPTCLIQWNQFLQEISTDVRQIDDLADSTLLNAWTRLQTTLDTLRKYAARGE